MVSVVSEIQCTNHWLTDYFSISNIVVVIIFKSVLAFSFEKKKKKLFEA